MSGGPQTEIFGNFRGWVYNELVSSLYLFSKVAFASSKFVSCWVSLKNYANLRRAKKGGKRAGMMMSQILVNICAYEKNTTTMIRPTTTHDC